MTTSRRSFLSGIIAAAVAPAIIRIPALIMPIKPALAAVPAQIGHVSLSASERELVDALRAAGALRYPSPHPSAGQPMSAVDAYVDYARKRDLIKTPEEYRLERARHAAALYVRARRENHQRMGKSLPFVEVPRAQYLMYRSDEDPGARVMINPYTDA